MQREREKEEEDRTRARKRGRGRGWVGGWVGEWEGGTSTGRDPGASQSSESLDPGPRAYLKGLMKPVPHLALYFSPCRMSPHIPGPGLGHSLSMSLRAPLTRIGLTRIGGALGRLGHSSTGPSLGMPDSDNNPDWVKGDLLRENPAPRPRSPRPARRAPLPAPGPPRSSRTRARQDRRTAWGGRGLSASLRFAATAAPPKANTALCDPAKSLNRRSLIPPRDAAEETEILQVLRAQILTSRGRCSSLLATSRFFSSWRKRNSVKNPEKRFAHVLHLSVYHLLKHSCSSKRVQAVQLVCYTRHRQLVPQGRSSYQCRYQNMLLQASFLPFSYPTSIHSSFPWLAMESFIASQGKLEFN